MTVWAKSTSRPWFRRVGWFAVLATGMTLDHSFLPDVSFVALLGYTLWLVYFVLLYASHLSEKNFVRTSPAIWALCLVALACFLKLPVCLALCASQEAMEKFIHEPEVARIRAIAAGSGRIKLGVYSFSNFHVQRDGTAFFYLPLAVDPCAKRQMSQGFVHSPSSYLQNRGDLYLCPVFDGWYIFSTRQNS